MKNVSKASWVCRALAFVVLVCVAAFSTQTVRAAGVWYVTPGGNDGNDCLSPVTSCATINGALNKLTFVAGDTIRISIGTFVGTGTEVVLVNKTAVLSGGWNADFTAQNGTSTIDGEKARRGIDVIGSVTLVVEAFTIQNGVGAGQGIPSGGGGIRNASGQVVVSRSRIIDNTFSGWGAGIRNIDGTLELVDSVVSGNVAGNVGGGILNGSGVMGHGVAKIRNSTIAGNKAGLTGSGGGGGAGVENFGGTVEIENSTVSGNTILGYFHGSGINNLGTLTVNNSTISGNVGIDAVYSQSTLSLNNTTVSNNTNRESGLRGFGAFTLQNSIIANNGTGAWSDCWLDSGYSTTFNSLGYNLIQRNYNCPLSNIDMTGVDPKLLPLQDNGGPTFTQALPPESPAINAGNPAGCSSNHGLLTTDQRGLPRNGRCDMGAFEYQWNDTTPPVVTIASPEAKSYLHTATFNVVWNATDVSSGIAAESGTLDGTAITNGQLVDLFYLTTGSHKVTVTAMDRAGYTTTVSVSFVIVADIDSLIAAENRTCTLGWINSKTVCNGLAAKLGEAKVAIQRGQYTAAKGNLNDFIAQLDAQRNKAVNQQAYDLLKSDALYVISHLP